MNENTNPDSIIVGGGVIGMMTARELLEAGLSVLLLERGLVGRESTWAGGGILSPLYPWRYEPAVTRLTSWSQERYPILTKELIEETGVDPEWTDCGLIALDGDREGRAREWSLHNRQPIESFARDRLREWASELNPEFSEALWMPNLAHIRSPRLINALRASLIKRGCDLKENEEVADILTDGNRVTGAKTTEGDYFSDRVVIAGGAWTPDLLTGMKPRLPIVPVRGQMILLHAKPGQIRCMYLYEGRYLIPRRDGFVLCGSTLEYAGFDKRSTQQALAELREFACFLCPALRDAPIADHWSGLRPGSPDETPWIGPHPAMEGVYVNSGHFRNGITLAPASARLLADMILGREPILDPLPYSLSRAASFS